MFRNNFRRHIKTVLGKSATGSQRPEEMIRGTSEQSRALRRERVRNRISARTESATAVSLRSKVHYGGPNVVVLMEFYVGDRIAASQDSPQANSTVIPSTVR